MESSRKDGEMFRLVYIVLVESLLFAPVRSAVYGHLVLNPDLNGRKCMETDTRFVKYLKSVISCALYCKDDFLCRSIFYNDQSKVCFACDKTYNSTSGLVAETGTKYFNTSLADRDCKKINEINPTAQTGVYSILPPGGREPVYVICDMETDGGGWTVFQYRFDGTVDFHLPRVNYINGFGSAYTEYWLGLESIHRLTKDTSSTVYLEFTDANDEVAIEKGNGFKVDGGPNYKLHVGAAVFFNDSDDEQGFLFQIYSGRSFSTIDLDLDWKSDEHCAENFRSGWWFRHCTFLNPNGEYVTPGTVSPNYEGYAGMINDIWRKRKSLKSTKLMFRRVR